MASEADGFVAHPLSLDEATKLIRCYAESEQTTRIFSGHARERMQERELHPLWISKVLRLGTVTERRNKNGSWRYKVSYTDKYGATYVVTAIPGTYKLVIVTVMRDE